MSLLQMFRHKLFKETSWSFASKGISFILFLILNVVLARGLGVELFGTWSFFLSVITICFTIAFFGINDSTRKFSAQHRGTDQLPLVLHDAIVLRLQISVIAILLFSAIAWPLSRGIGRPDFAPLFYSAILMVLFSTTAEFVKNVFIGIHRIKYHFLITVIEHGGKLIFVVLYLAFAAQLNGIIFAYTAALFLATAVGAGILYSRYSVSSAEPGKYRKSILKYSFPLVFISIGFLLMTEIDTLMIGLFIDDVEVGVYAVAKQITNKLPHIALAIAMGTMPVFARITDSNISALRRLFIKILSVNMVIFGLIVLGLLFFAPLIITTVFGADFSGSIPVLQILSVYMLLFSFSVYLSRFLDYQGRANRRAINMTITIILNIGLNVVLIPRFGALGAAWSTVISYIPYIMLNGIETAKVLLKEDVQ